jgi:hypothetical protein
MTPFAAWRNTIAACALASAAACTALPAGAACPADRDAAAGTLLSVRIGTQSPVRLDRAAIARFATQQSVQRRTVASSSSVAPVEQQIAYTGVPLAAIVSSVAGDDPQARDQRGWVFDATATDGYRAIFSWGELFNSDAGEQVLVIVAQDGKALDDREGPLALRALADHRPGPRHVRNLCAVIARPMPAPDR